MALFLKVNFGTEKKLNFNLVKGFRVYFKTNILKKGGKYGVFYDFLFR